MDKRQYYEFSQFRLDAEKRILRRGGEIVALAPKSYEVLLVLVERHGRLVTYDELKRLAWTESRYVEDKTLTQTVYTLRTLLGDSSKTQAYIENVPKRGYRFVAEVTSPQAEEVQPAETLPIETTPEIPAEKLKGSSAAAAGRKLLTAQKILILLCALILFGGAAIAGLYWLVSRSASSSAPTFPHGSASALEEVRSPSDETAIRRLLEESQKYESLTIDADPTAFNERNLPDYWLPAELGGKEIINVRNSLKRLQEKELHYGSESRNDRFEIRYVRVFSPREYAEAGTIERWFLPLYRTDGSRIEGRNEYLGTYEVDYALRKIGGRWLIEETSTPRYQEKK